MLPHWWFSRCLQGYDETMIATTAAICHRCGGDKTGPFVPCKACGFVPTADARAVAWLFSLSHLDQEELTLAAARIRAGETPDPPTRLRLRARQEMGATALDEALDIPLSTPQLAGLAAANVFLTPLVGFALWFGVRTERPQTATQILRITIPIAFALGLVWAVMVALRFSGPVLE